MALVSDGITGLLEEWNGGSNEALEKLLPLVYRELRRLAAGYLRRERPDHTLQATALVHEAYLHLLELHHIRWQNRAHFVGVAAQMMRRVLVDHARVHNAEKRGGGQVALPLDDDLMATPARDLDLLALDEALERLAAAYPEKARVVELRFFGGLSIDETAGVLEISTPTVERDWRFAKAWLRAELGG
ncbi:MAG TPA: sigma-70 family RNA polymerase sigma factor [Pyrinomonadaceae bacterium]|jgi:RNA polymerase sigma factor (TIGR02999 family)|nr:sigma-70 family RNA polymerase sigma factor [Pyrinomonadaceae bacterium]